MLHHSIGDVGDGHLGSWGYQEGGMGGVSDACRRAAESFGAEIRTGAKVAKILVRGGRTVGVALENGDELRAPVVVTTVHPKISFLDLIDEADLPADFVRDIRNFKTRSGVVKVNFAISELPDFIADPARSSRTTTPGRSSSVSAPGTPSRRSRTPTFCARRPSGRSSTA
jgi:phytoene dehydrogenase-like protein